MDWEQLSENNIIEIQEKIDFMFENQPDKRKKVDFKKWKEKIELLMNRYNVETKHKSYPSKI